MLPAVTDVAPPRPRTGPEASDLFLFAAAAVAVWFLRRSLRRRFGKRHDR